MSLIEAGLKHCNLLLLRPHNAPLVCLQKVPSTLIHHRPILLPHLLRLNPPIPLPHRPLITAVPLLSTGAIQPSPSPLPPHLSSPMFANVLGGKADKPQSAPVVQNQEACGTRHIWPQYVPHPRAAATPLLTTRNLHSRKTYMLYVLHIIYYHV